MSRVLLIYLVWPLIWIMHKATALTRSAVLAILGLATICVISSAITSGIYQAMNRRFDLAGWTRPRSEVAAQRTPSYSIVSLLGGRSIRFQVTNKENPPVIAIDIRYRAGEGVFVQPVGATAYRTDDGERLWLLHVLPPGSWTPGTYRIEMPVTAPFLLSLFDDELKRASEAGFERPAPDAVREARKAFRELVFGRLQLDKLGGETWLPRVLNGPIQYWTLMAFVMLAMLLICRYWIRVFLERWLLHHSPGVAAARQLQPLDRTLNQLEREREEWRSRTALKLPWLQQIAWEPEALRTIEGAVEWKLRGMTSGEVPSLVDHDAEAIGARWESEYELIRYLVWVIPSLGFIGTILGIGAAMLATGGVASPDEVARTISRSLVTSQIGVAFDTTFVALVLSIVGMLAVHLIQGFEGDTIAEIEEQAMAVGSETRIGADQGARRQLIERERAQRMLRAEQDAAAARNRADVAGEARRAAELDVRVARAKLESARQATKAAEATASAAAAVAREAESRAEVDVTGADRALEEAGREFRSAQQTAEEAEKRVLVVRAAVEEESRQQQGLLAQQGERR